MHFISNAAVFQYKCEKNPFNIDIMSEHMGERERIAKAAGKMSFATLISRILGYVKDMILAFYFGATGISDAFFAAFRITNFLRELFAEGAMSSAFIPVLTENRHEQGEEEAKRVVKITFSFILVFAGIVCLLGILFAPAIVSVITHGFTDQPEKFSLTVLLTRIMFPFLLFISLSALIMGALNTKKVFFIPALSPAMLNITIIITVIALVPLLKLPIIAVAIGVTIGGLVQFVFQLPSFYKKNYSLGFSPHFGHPALKKMAILLIPATLALAVNQVYILVSLLLASYLVEGSITYLYYSMRLIQFPIGIFIVAIGQAALPTLSEHAVKGDYEKLRDDFSFALRLLIFISVPSMAGLIALREPIVNILFQRGTFDYIATQATAEALLFYSLAIWAIGGVKVLTVTFYSLQDTKTPVKIAALGFAVNLILSLILMGPLKHSGLALAFSLAASLNAVLLFYFLRKKLEHVDIRRIMRSLIKAVAASVIMGFAGWTLLNGERWQTSGDTMEKALYLAATIIVCIILYAVFSFLLKSEEMTYIFETFKNKIRNKGAVL
jgi:putative peptidoglycan lipid II flippase